MYETERQQLSGIGTQAILNGCILSTNIPQDTADNQIPHHASSVNTSRYERIQDLLASQQGDGMRMYSSDQPPKPPTRHHSNIGRSSRKGDFGGAIRSARTNNRSSARGYLLQDQVEETMIDVLNPELARPGHADGGQLVVSLPHMWTQQQNLRHSKR